MVAVAIRELGNRLIIKYLKCTIASSEIETPVRFLGVWSVVHSTESQHRGLKLQQVWNRRIWRFCSAQGER